MMERNVKGDFKPIIAKKSPLYLKEKRLAEKKLREKNARVFSNLELPEIDI